MIPDKELLGIVWQSLWDRQTTLIRYEYDKHSLLSLKIFHRGSQKEERENSFYFYFLIFPM